jgi:hypothetical protein
MWNLPGCFRLPAKACRPQPRLRLLDRLFTVQGSVSNHEQGRVNLLPFPKNVPPDSTSTLAPNGRFLKQNFRKFSGYGAIAGGKARGRPACLKKNDFRAVWRFSPGLAVKQIKTPPLPCATTPANFHNMRDGRIVFDDQLRCRLQSQLVSLIVYFQFNAMVPNHEQGRVNSAAIFQRTVPFCAP